MHRFHNELNRKLSSVRSQPLPVHTQPAITCSKLITETLEQCIKYAQSYQ